MTIDAEPLPGCFVMSAKRFVDERGDFFKPFQSSEFARLGLPSAWHEDFYSTSGGGVIRGMHFQKPPHEHDKLVYCLFGRILDVMLDLRDGPGFGKVFSIELLPGRATVLFIPRGIAHGFLAIDDNSVVAYKTTTEHDPASDAGIRWDSFGFRWPHRAPILSQRDRGLPPLDSFSTPFRAAL